MDIAVIGAGNVGGTPGTRWAQNGHRVAFGVRNVRDPKSQQLVKGAGSNARAAAVGEVAAGASVVLLATP